MVKKNFVARWSKGDMTKTLEKKLMKQDINKLLEKKINEQNTYTNQCRIYINVNEIVKQKL